MYVALQFDYKGNTYLYCMDTATVHNDIVDLAFLYKEHRFTNEFVNVQDDRLFNELMEHAHKISIIREIKKKHNL